MLLITSTLESNHPGGRKLLSHTNFQSLQEIYDQKLQLLELAKPAKSFLRKFIDIFKGHIDGCSDKSILDAFSLIEKYNIQDVFIDGSNFGAFASAIRKEFPNIRIIIFFHNVEFNFFYGAFKSNYSVHSFGVMVANYVAEYKSMKHSNHRITLSERDSQQLKKIYKKGATHISGMAMVDKFSLADFKNISREPSYEKYALFVGGNFYANRDGIIWFLNNVAPKINLKIVIIGRGLEDLKEQFIGVDNIEIIGEVDSVIEWYLKSQFVIAPIFDGSGMKTKVSEAMMFGRKVVGSMEAFSGYEKFIKEVGWLCSSSDDFINAINIAHTSIINPYHSELRKIFKKHFSQDASTLRLKKILQ